MPEPQGIYLSDVGAGLDEIEPFTLELEGIVQEMQEKLVNETKILEGTELPEYAPLDLGIPKLTEEEFYKKFGLKNELSDVEENKEEWNNDSPSGYWTIDLTHGSTLESSISPSIAGFFNQDCPMRRSNRQWSRPSTPLCEVKLDDSGNAIDATSESSVCTVPMISEPTDGMPNEEK